MYSVFDEGPFPACPAQFNLAAYVLARAGDLPEKDALVLSGPEGNVSWTYAALQRAVLGTATGLLRAGLQDGDRLLIRLGNSVDFPIVFLGAIAAGIVPVPTSSQLTAPEVDAQIDILQPTAILHAPQVACPAHSNIIPVQDAQHWRGFKPATPAPGDPNRLAYIVFTSGTAAEPKAVAHAHRAIWARRMMIDDWASLRESDRLMHAGAFNWTYTLGTGLLDPWVSGATALIPQEGVKPDELMTLLGRTNATIFASSPGVYRKVLKQLDKIDLPHLRHGLSAGEKLAPETAARWRTATGTEIFEAYGLSECSTFISGAPGRPATPDALGRPQRGRRVALMDKTGPVPLGAPGTIALHKDDPGLMLGYLNAPAETAARFHGDWFLTGDQAIADNQFQLTYLGRSDDLINAGGLRVSPLEIEKVLLEVPGVTGAAAVEARLRSDTSVIAAFYTAPTPVDDSTFEGYVTQKLARFKHPRLYIHLADLPTGANGKIMRRRLRARFEDQDD